MASLPKAHGFCSFKGKIEKSAWQKHRHIHTHKKRKLVTQTCTAKCNRTWQSEISWLVTGTLRERLSENKMLRSAYLACICLCACVNDTVMNDEVTWFAFQRESSRWSESCLCACERTAAEAKATGSEHYITTVITWKSLLLCPVIFYLDTQGSRVTPKFVGRKISIWCHNGSELPTHQELR